LQDTARIYDQLMERLDYKAYVAQAGDWGHWVRKMDTRVWSGSADLVPENSGLAGTTRARQSTPICVQEHHQKAPN
jgi:hypothetical protein